MVTERTYNDASNFINADNSYIERFGTTMTLNKKTITLDAMGRMTNVSTTSVTIEADIQWVTKQDLLHLNIGDVQVGDGILYPKISYGISLEDEIEYNNITWRIVEQVEGEELGGTMSSEAYIIRKND